MTDTTRLWSRPTNTRPLLASDDVLVVDETHTSTLAAPEARTIALPPVRSTTTDKPRSRSTVHKATTPDIRKPVSTTPPQAAPKSTGEIDAYGNPIEYTPTGRRKRAKVNRKPEFTKQDAAICREIYWMGWATITHIAYAVDNVPHNLRGRMTDLVKRGYLRMSTGDSMSQYCVTDMALEELGIDDHGPKGKPNASGTAHRNKLNTILLRLSLGWERAAETVERDVSSKQSRYAYENRRKADANAVLMRDKQRILAMDPANRTAADNRILHRKPAAMTEPPTEKDMVEHMGLAHDDSDERNDVFNESRVVIPERFIVRDTSITTTLGCKVDWEAECEQFLRETPVHDASNATLSKVMEQHKAWVFTHWDVNGKWGKSHRPDGVVILPSKVDSNGEVRGGCIWIEMEDHRKPQVADYVRVIQQAIDHPLVDAVYYYTPHRSVSTMIKKAVDTVVKELVAGDRSNRSFEAKESDARELVARSVRVLKQPLINRMASEGGYWG